MGTVCFEPNGRNRTPDVVHALLHAQDNTALHFANGRYDFYADGAYEDVFFPSCNRSGDKKVIFPLIRLKNIIIDGSGADFIFHDRVFPFIVQRCEDVILRDFSIDFTFPRCCVCQVVSAGDEGILLDIGSSGCQYRVNQSGNLGILAGSDLFSTCERRFFLKQDGKVCFLSAGDIYYENTGLPAEIFYCQAKQTPEGVLLCYNENTRYRPDFIPGPLMISYDERRENDIFFLDRDTRVLLENIRIFHGAGMGVIGQLCENLSFHRFDIAPPEGSNDVYSTTADGILLSNCTGLVDISDCRIERTMDDAISIHGFYTRVERLSAPTKAIVRLMHVSLSGYNPYFPGDTLTISDGTRMHETGTIMVKSSRFEDDPYLIFLEFACDITDRLHAGDLLENPFRTPEVAITNSVFADFPHIRLSSARHMLFTGNTVNNCSGILFNDLTNYWYVSGSVNSAQVKNNTFSHIQTAIRTLLERPAGCGVRHKRIEITGNRFENCECLLQADEVNLLTFTGNTFDTGIIKLNNCFNTDIQDINGAEQGLAGQLLMQWDIAEIEVPAAPPGYTLHQYHRDGDNILSESDFQAGWLNTVFQGKPYAANSFAWLNDDKRIPDDGFFVVLDSAGMVVSTASVQLGEHTPDSATLHMVATDINHRGQGLGKITTLAAMDYMRKCGVKTSYLTTDDFRLPAVAIYLKFGYKPVLYKPDMRARWIALAKRLGLDCITVVDETGKLSSLKG